MIKYPATYKVTTVNGDTFCCGIHAGKLYRLMHFMGSYADVEPIQKSNGMECQNCINEARKRGGLDGIHPS